jgi:conjugative transfer region protein (TIGR03748 family)
LSRSQTAPDVSDAAGPPKQPTTVHYGRYRLIDTVPEPDEQNLLMQIVDVAIPAHVTPTVGQALRYVLLRSGYQLCSERQEIAAIDGLPLPAAHMHLGPLELGDALQLLVGPAWSLESNEEARVICFARRSGATDQLTGANNTGDQPDPIDATTGRPE